MEIVIIIILPAVLICIWIFFTQRRLTALNENVNNAMNGMGIQLSDRLDKLVFLLDLTKSHAICESETLIAAIRTQRRVITAKSTPGDVLRQENIINQALIRITAVTEKCSGLKANENYARAMDALRQNEMALRASRLIYNDSVTRLNRAFRVFPANIPAKILGFHKRVYITDA